MKFFKTVLNAFLVTNKVFWFYFGQPHLFVDSQGEGGGVGPTPTPRRGRGWSGKPLPDPLNEFFPLNCAKRRWKSIGVLEKKTSTSRGEGGPGSPPGRGGGLGHPLPHLPWPECPCPKSLGEGSRNKRKRRPCAYKYRCAVMEAQMKKYMDIWQRIPGAPPPRICLRPKIHTQNFVLEL